GVGADDVDLTERGVDVFVDLGPAEPRQAAVLLVEQKAVGVEPRLRLAVADGLQIPLALLGVVAEGPVVDLEPGFFVLARTERTYGQRLAPAAVLVVDGEWSPHL